MVTRTFAIGLFAASLGGCVIQANSSRNPTLPYHSDRIALEAQAVDVDRGATLPPAPRMVAADLRVEELVGYYPDLYGLTYSSDGAFRKIDAASYVPSDGSTPRPEQLLTAAVRRTLLGSGAPPAALQPPSSVPPDSNGAPQATPVAPAEAPAAPAAEPPAAAMAPPPFSHSVLLTGAVTELAMYQLGGHDVAGAALELRVVVDGQEVYTARYRASAQTRRSDRPGLEILWPAIEADLLRQLTADSGLIAAVEKGGQS